MKSNRLACTECKNLYPPEAFRQGSKGRCVWCQWQSAEARARARYNDKRKSDVKRKLNAAKSGLEFVPHLIISEAAFMKWYLEQPDNCYYCGITTKQLRELQLKRGAFGYSVSWDIDRKDPARFYEKGNLALSCFMCNMAKGSYFTEVEALKLGKAVKSIMKARLAVVRKIAA